MAGVHMDWSDISVLLYVLRRTMGGTWFACVFLFLGRFGAFVCCPWSIFTNCTTSFLRVSHGYYYYYNGFIQCQKMISLS